MPCVSDYVEPSKRQREFRRAARLYVAARRMLGRSVDPKNVAASKDEYCKVDLIPKLCKFIRENEQLLFEAMWQRYSGEVPGRELRAHTLAEHDLRVVEAELYLWWCQHQRADYKREEQEKKDRAKTNTKREAAQKLSADERKLLGINEDGEQV